MTEDIRTRVTRRGFIGGIMALLVARPKFGGFLSSVNDPIEKVFLDLYPAILLSGDSMSITHTLTQHHDDGTTSAVTTGPFRMVAPSRSSAACVTRRVESRREIVTATCGRRS